MTLDTFLAELKDVAIRKPFHLCGSYIRHGYYLKDLVECPLTAVYNDKNPNDKIGVGEYDLAAKHLKLAEYENKIVWAADGNGNHDVALRQKLLEACGLREKCVIRAQPCNYLETY